MTRPRALTRSESRLVMAVALVALVCGLALCWRARAEAHDRLALARADHAGVVAQARRLLALSSERALAADRPRAQPDLVARLQSSLRGAGVDPSRLTQVSASEPRPVARSASSAGGNAGGHAGGGGSGGGASGGSGGGGVFMRQETGVTLEGVRPADLARFLAAWREAEPLWIVRVVSLQRGPGAPDAEERYTALLTLETLFTDLPGRVPRAASAAPTPRAHDGLAATESSR